MSDRALTKARRALQSMIARMPVGALDAETFLRLAGDIAVALDEIEDGPMAEQLDMLLQGPNGHLVGLPLTRMRFVGKLAVIEGGKA